MRDQGSRWVQGALAQLSERDREVLIMHYLEQPRVQSNANPIWSRAQAKGQLCLLCFADSRR
jgi:hypothetical protein